MEIQSLPLYDLLVMEHELTGLWRFIGTFSLAIQCLGSLDGVIVLQVNVFCGNSLIGILTAQHERAL